MRNPRYYIRFIQALITLQLLGAAELYAQKQEVVQHQKPVVFPTIADKLTARAENLFSEGKLTRPESENAYTLFRAAQIIEPDHEAAGAGLKAILIAKTGYLKDKIALSKFSQVKREINYLETLYPQATLLENLRRDLHKAMQVQSRKHAVAKQPVRKQSVKDAKVIAIDEAALSAKSPKLIEELAELAQKISKTNEGVLIFARSDAQARWMYQQMRKAVPGYRVRGDLRIGAPSIQLLQPFN